MNCGGPIRDSGADRSIESGTVRPLKPPLSPALPPLVVNAVEVRPVVPLSSVKPNGDAESDCCSSCIGCIACIGIGTNAPSRGKEDSAFEDGRNSGDAACRREEGRKEPAGAATALCSGAAEDAAGDDRTGPAIPAPTTPAAVEAAGGGAEDS